MHVEHVGGGVPKLERHDSPRAQNRADDESSDRSPVDCEATDADTLPLRGGRFAVGRGAADDAHVMPPRDQPRRLLPEHPRPPAFGRRGRDVGDHEDTELRPHAPLT